ncbi:hypothetical protein F5148DRAFT_1148225 [Russula earlei]|uniref:Uncharacterized protein n=1 Tax=Russula earlei TaxID=71964 RepID=A0ACC0UDI3_9AGAM|nr:hypothetical protein F5148DRAFT_1148225 [Russula earlei]
MSLSALRLVAPGCVATSLVHYSAHNIPYGNSVCGEISFLNKFECAFDATVLKTLHRAIAFRDNGPSAVIAKRGFTSETRFAPSSPGRSVGEQGFIDACYTPERARARHVAPNLRQRETEISRKDTIGA